MSDVSNKVVWGTSATSDAAAARDALRRLAEESSLAFEDLVELWSTDTAMQLAAASAALAVGNLAEAARLTHSASGASGICKIAALAEELKTAERLARDGRARAAKEALEKAERRFAALNTALTDRNAP